MTTFSCLSDILFTSYCQQDVNKMSDGHLVHVLLTIRRAILIQYRRLTSSHAAVASTARITSHG